MLMRSLGMRLGQLGWGLLCGGLATQACGGKNERPIDVHTTPGSEGSGARMGVGGTLGGEGGMGDETGGTGGTAGTSGASGMAGTSGSAPGAPTVRITS